VRPLAEEAAALTKTNRIAVVGTRSTIESGTYIEELKKLKPEIAVIQQACPLLVPLVEEGYERKPETRKILRTYLAPVKSANPDVLILGCTHYEALRHLFEQNMGRKCKVLDSPLIVAEKLKKYLERHPEYASHLSHGGKVQFLTTGDPKRFKEVGERFYGGKMGEVKRVMIG
jgi:glutamate racemase